ncbi:radical sam [Lucifera butyrica]|uniref:Radical sam n=1 Tax=Lucifera butyrica TaxID=1351585 RepID=A0A498RDV2_9FIRM|nr:glycyl-radical enzyme activating protein [Lucifera butyrica]VBB09674.1 radical sam [Lucifera butyrica]
MKKALIFNLQKFCVHDGPGIRTTVFFKGCPLHCLWCHNPESQSFHKEMLFNPEQCTGCGQCIRSCSQGALSQAEKYPVYDAAKCLFCETCIDHCIYNARELAGREYTVGEILREIEKDRPFYDQSGGGVTFSGGEALAQIDFVAELAGACRERGISVALDTCGYAPFDSFSRLLDRVDVFLYDIKLMDAGLHRQYTGVDNSLILENLRRLSAQQAEIHLRLPLIEGINTNDGHINGVIDLCRDVKVAMVNLLPYHAIGQGKYRKLGMEPAAGQLAKPSEQRLAEIQSRLERAHLKVKIGG